MLAIMAALARNTVNIQCSWILFFSEQGGRALLLSHGLGMCLLAGSKEREGQPWEQQGHRAHRTHQESTAHLGTGAAPQGSPAWRAGGRGRDGTELGHRCGESRGWFAV